MCVLAQTQRRESRGRLVLSPTQRQQSLAVVAGGVLLQEGDRVREPPTDTCSGEAQSKALGTGKV